MTRMPTQRRAGGSATRRQAHFTQIEGPRVPRSKLPRSCKLHTTFDVGKLIPIFLDEILPGDTISMQVHTFGRMATPLHPVLDGLKVDTHFFFVPYRLVWDNWKAFMGERLTPDDTTEYSIPIMDNCFVQNQSNLDYFGLPQASQALEGITALPLRALRLIWNEWFRDPALQEALSVLTGDGPDDVFTEEYLTLLPRNKRKDYFTSCRPWLQAGPEVPLPVGDRAAVLGTGIPGDYGTNDGVGPLEVDGDENVSASWNNTGVENLFFDADKDIGAYADLENATGATVNSMRLAVALQHALEAEARGGQRYTEIIQNRWGVTSLDSRLQRPEYLGGTTQDVKIHPIPQTSATDDNVSPQGNLAAMGTTSHSGRTWTKSFTEHGMVIGVASARGDLIYQDGVERMWSRRTKEDFYWPEFAHLGEQAVEQREIFTDGGSGDRDVFGYQERWAEYKYKPSRVTGLMRDDGQGGNLSTWNLAYKFTTQDEPSLSAEFLYEDPPVSRVVAVPSEPDMIFDCKFDYNCTRAMPVHSTPGLRRL